MQNSQSVSDFLAQTISHITPLNQSAVREAKIAQSMLALPPGSLGELLKIAQKLSGITGEIHNSLPKKRIIVLCADNGVVREGVSSAPQSVTARQAVNMTKGRSGMAALAAHFGNEVQVVDVGIACDYDCPAIVNRKIRNGTDSILHGKAMTKEEAERAIAIGIELAEQAKSDGVHALGVGEMGIGNTTTSTAVLSVLTKTPSERITGRGGCITDEMLAHKKEVIARAIEKNKPDANDVIDVLSCVGGFDIASMCGVFLGAARHKIPVVIDGYISIVAALCAFRLCKTVRDYLFPSHISEEKGYKIAMKEFSLSPYLHLGMRLGEGSGCPLAFEILDAACVIMNDMATFEQAHISDDYLQGLRDEL
ncbi:MAG: nicotinate-nucleotide--dimethylbenzimidazole phosphoribosyltransferase [Treponema sp.]|nr:nicotinate-nucleotide--dimethylbenzimidazole phosphoribosyltransferase [Treponema sp.]